MQRYSFTANQRLPVQFNTKKIISWMKINQYYSIPNNMKIYYLCVRKEILVFVIYNILDLGFKFYI